MFLETTVLVFLEMIVLVFLDVSRDDCAGVSRNDSRARDSRNESRADDDSRYELSTYVDSRNSLCVEVDFQRDDETFLDVRKDDVTFLDVQTDGVTLPVPCSSSSFSLCSVVVVGPRENVCSDMILESDGGTDDSTSGPLAKSAEMKRLVEIAVANGALKQVKVEQQPQSGPFKRVLTPSAKASKHLRARDKKLRETLCWWIANDKVCPHGDRCNFRHTVSETGALSPSPAPDQTVCETGVSWPGLATEQDESETGVLSPGPSTNPTYPRSPTRDSWNNSWDRYDYRVKCTDVWKSGHDGNRWIHRWNEHYHGDNWTDAWRERNPGFKQQHDDDNSTDAWNKCKSDDEWRASHWETSSWSSSHWETSGWNDADECSDDRKGQLWSSHSFFETMNMEPVDQLPLQGRWRCHFLWN